MAKRPPKSPKSAPLKRDVDPPLVSQPIRQRDPRQPTLPFDQMPDRVEPCLALLSSKVPAGPEWSYEVKWDGYRLAVHVEPAGVRIITRGGHDWTHRFPAIAGAARALGPATMILDGEAVVLDEQGRSDFSALQQALGGRGGKRTADEAIFYAFDLLYFDGHDLTSMALYDRRQMLEDVVGAGEGTIRLSEAIEADGAELLRNACSLGLEGIIAKHQDRPYRAARNCTGVGHEAKVCASYKQVDRQWPYQVAVPAAQTRGRIFNEVLVFCRGMSLSPRSLGIRHDGIDYNIWCFADPEHARLFKEQYHGLDFDPKDRGKGTNWRSWNRPTPFQKSDD